MGAVRGVGTSRLTARKWRRLKLSSGAPARRFPRDRHGGWLLPAEAWSTLANQGQHAMTEVTSLFDTGIPPCPRPDMQS